VLRDRSADGEGTVTEYLALIEKDGEAWGAYVPDFPGCVAVAQSRAEVELLIAEAVPLHIASMREQGEPVPAPTAVDSMKVTVTQT
jgi:predicted RNase H-like HicB family nuclease